ncbi:TetR/AcrR family transcriptional regulator [Bhargavaea beijingensis]|uniref:Transcriptional regulator, TetR family n=1 Tax=Bhargavaea beijingensis TaxID=426756 RepID=A0A1G6YCK1_9BACL|nr:TetR/AcrR family transcriptional regulator [Bhargavaea beijingensis]MCW1927792.1 TetR/AcrR family transcriptional regulator [Bhargavaea beijingensis]SDD87326.1 transcriptional regulator, TetR family [Bhargavaea beijingensis]
MNETKKRIIEAAITLFTEKGFHGTPIQEIAVQAGISKGAFYLHFKSKDALQVEIFRYYTSLIQEEMERAVAPGLSAEENFRRQTEVQIAQMQRHIDFIIMVIREQAFSLNPELIRFIEELRVSQADWYRDQLTSIYGEAIRPYTHDIYVITEGIKSHYMQQFISNPQALNPETLTDLIVRMTGQAAEGFLGGTLRPLLDDETLRALFSGLFPEEEEPEDVSGVIEAMRTTLCGLAIPRATAQYLQSTLDFLETQAAAGAGADRTAINGALSVFRPYPAFRDSLQEMKEKFALADE